MSDIENSDSNAYKYQMLFDKAHDAIVLSKGALFFDVNNKACEYFQYTKEEFIGMSVMDISPKFQDDGQESEKKIINDVKRTLEGHQCKFEWQHKRANGEIFDALVSLSKIEIQDEVYIQAVMRDITEENKRKKELEKYRNHLEQLVQQRTQALEKTTEEWKSTSKDLANKNTELQETVKKLQETKSQLIQKEKMASLGILTAGVSHEINNPLQYLSATYYGLVNYFKKDESSTNLLLSSTETAIDKIASIVKGLNQFSRDNSKFNEDCDIHSIIDNCLTVLHNQFKHKVDIKKNYCKKETIVKGNVGKLHQVFLNILSNAIAAIDKEGSINITTKYKKENIQIEIEDTGRGIKEEDLPKIVDPFFTTKEPGEGTGLGLSITYSILQDHNGQLKFQSQIDRGTKAIILLPNK